MNTQQRIDVERRRLQKAQAILVCAVHASIHNLEADYGDLMGLAASIIDHVVNALDAVEMNRRDEARAVVVGLHDAAQACTPDQAALRARLEQAAEVIDKLLEVHPTL